MKGFSEELIAPCGMNCKICLAYFGYTTTGKKRKMRCVGCKPTNKSCAHLKKYCKNKTINEVEYCYECSDFPCEQLKKLDSKYRERYNMSMIENLENIKKEGIKKFLIQQKKEWACLKCGGIVCCHNGICFNCDLDKLVNKKKLYRWE